MAHGGDRESGWEAPFGERRPGVHAEGAPGKVTRSGLLPSQLVHETTPTAGANGQSDRPQRPERMPDWDPDSLIDALGLAPDPARWSEGEAPAGTLSLGQGEASAGAAKHQPTAPAAGAPTATMHVRALDATGGLLQEWIGPAYFVGELPVSYQGVRTARGWSWTRDGEAAAEGAKLKLESDARGQAGRSLGQWAPPGARAITCDFAARTAPFGAGAQPLPSDGAPRGPTAVHEADGNAPIGGAAGAALALEGPERPVAFREHGALTALDEARGSTITLGPGGKSTLRLHGAPSEYLYRIAPQTSPRQRVVQVTASFDVGIESDLDPLAPVELVPQARRVGRDELATLRAAAQDTTALRLRSPEISATGDAWRAELRLGASAITMTALGEGARFAYWVDPQWNGPERTVHVVATPGVRIDEAQAERAPLDGDLRRLRANRIYVQDPRRVPQQGEPIDPAAFLGIERHDNSAPEISPHPANRNAFQVATGGTGITVRDLSSGARLRVFAEDPTLGARFLHQVEGNEVRVLVGKGARVEIEQARQSPHLPSEAPDPHFDFRQVAFRIYQARNEVFPPPGTPLSLATLQRYGEPREADRVAWVEPQKGGGQLATESLLDVGLSVTPGVGDLMDLADAAAVATMGTDKWGNPLSTGEKVAVVVVALLPLAAGGAVLGARRMAGPGGMANAGRVAGEAASGLARLASKAGRTEEELAALLATVGKLDDEGRLAARRLERAIDLGEDIDAADLARLERSLGRAGFRGGGFAVPQPARFGAGAAAAEPRAVVRTSQLEERERTLQQALRSYARKLGVRGAAARAPVQVLPKAHFVQRFGSESARAVCQITERGPVIVARVDATAQDLLDEAAHLAQLADPKLAPALRYLDERNLEDWPQLSVPDRLGFYEAKLEIEIDAKHRTLRAVRDEADRRVAEAALEALERRQAELAALDPADVARMASGELPPPQFLAEPPRLFGKERKVIEELPSPPGSANATEAGRAVARDKGSPDYSGAYSMEGVTEVRQRGDSWLEIDYVTADVKGKIVSRTVDEEGATHLVIEGGGTRRDHIFEPNAEIDPRMKPGRKVEAGERLGKDSAREYRRVELTFADGGKHVREEIRSQRDGRGWVQRGQESTARGRAAEERARAAADLDLNARKAKGEISSFFHIPHRVGGGGFDDVIVEFAGEGEAMQVKVRIREVKDYANRRISMSDAPSLTSNLKNNMDELLKTLRTARERKLKGQDAGFANDMSIAQIESVINSARRMDVHLELCLGPGTKHSHPEDPSKLAQHLSAVFRTVVAIKER